MISMIKCGIGREAADQINKNIIFKLSNPDFIEEVVDLDVFEFTTKEEDALKIDRELLLLRTGCSTPSHNILSHPLIKKCGTYYGGFHDDFKWNNLGDLTHHELFEVWTLCGRRTF